MSHVRRALRSRIKDRLRALDHFAGWSEVSAWAAAIDEARLPAWGVALPREDVSAEASDADVPWRAHVYRLETVLLGVKRRGGDALEDALDDDAEAAEAGLMTLFADLGLEAEFAALEQAISDQGGQRIGTLSMTFRVRVYGLEGDPGNHFL